MKLTKELADLVQSKHKFSKSEQGIVENAFNEAILDEDPVLAYALWFLLIKNLNNLFLVHPAIEDGMVKIARKVQAYSDEEHQVYEDKVDRLRSEFEKGYREV